MVGLRSAFWHWLVGHEMKVSMTHISLSRDFALYLEDYLMYEHHTLGLWVSITPTFNLKINVGYCDLYFMVQWFCLISWRLFDIWTSYFWIMSQYDMTFDLKINVGHCDLYFMVQRFCHFSWRLDIWTPFFWIMSQYSLMFDLKIYVGHYDLYFMIQWFCLISWKLFSDWTSYICTLGL